MAGANDPQAYGLSRQGFPPAPMLTQQGTYPYKQNYGGGQQGPSFPPQDDEYQNSQYGNRDGWFGYQ